MQNLSRRCTACFFPRRYRCGPTTLHTLVYTLHTHWYTPGLICLVVRLAAGELDIGGEINQRQQLPLTHNARPQAGCIFRQRPQIGAYIPTTASKGSLYSDNARPQAGVYIPRNTNRQGCIFRLRPQIELYILAISRNKIVYSDTGVYSLYSIYYCSAQKQEKQTVAITSMKVNEYSIHHVCSYLQSLLLVWNRRSEHLAHSQGRPMRPL